MGSILKGLRLLQLAGKSIREEEYALGQLLNQRVTDEQASGRKATINGIRWSKAVLCQRIRTPRETLLGSVQKQQLLKDIPSTATTAPCRYSAFSVRGVMQNKCG